MTKHCLRYTYTQDCELSYSCESCSDFGYRTCDALKKLGTLSCTVNLAIDCKDCDMSEPEGKDCDIPKAKGMKFDDGKPRWDLLPVEPLKELVQVLTFGAEKYGPNNWRKIEDATNRYYSACMRHLMAYKSGELNDPETRLSHIAHAMCNLLFMYEVQEWPGQYT